MKVIKNTLSLLVIVAILVFLLFNKEVTEYINTNYIRFKEKDIYLEKNIYAKNESYSYVSISNKFTVSNYQELINTFYTVLDSGTNEFSFYCDKKYKTCIDDINKIVPNNNTGDIMAELNNFVHPYNSYKSITIITNNYGKITVKFEKIYTEEMIKEVDKYIDDFIKENIKDDMDDYEKIKLFHDYIIDNTKYDIDRADDVNSEQYKDSPSHTAYGVVKNSVALCGGYSDIMAIYLNKIGIKNIKIAAKLHVWNLVFIDGKWLNLDVTWDDPVTSTGIDMLIHEYFLIDSKKLLEIDNIEHIFDQNIYIEAK